jgi:hypothetical protein
MRFFRGGVLIRTTVLVGTLFMISCATTQQTQQKEGISVADIGNYSVKMPVGKHWQVTIEKEKETVTFLNERAKTDITVSRLVLAESKWHMSEEEIADTIANSQTDTVKDILRKDAERSAVAKFLTGSFEVQFINKSIAVVDGKKLHTLHFRLLAGGDAVFRKIGFEKKQFVYFGSDFPTKHTFYMFSIFKTYPRSLIPPHDSRGLGEKEILLIHDIINSLQVK